MFYIDSLKKWSLDDDLQMWNGSLFDVDPIDLFASCLQPRDKIAYNWLQGVPNNMRLRDILERITGLQNKTNNLKN